MRRDVKMSGIDFVDAFWDYLARRQQNRSEHALLCLHAVWCVLFHCTAVLLRTNIASGVSIRQARA
jgi:hypothetical protein